MRQVRTYPLSKDRQLTVPCSRPLLRLLLLNRRVSGKARGQIDVALSGLPRLSGEPITLDLKPQLTAHRGKLLSRSPEKGVPVFAASFIRQRRIVIESELLAQPPALRLILIHEIFHFVWLRLSNSARHEFAAILKQERGRGAKGELGESAAVKKAALVSGQSFTEAQWRDYVCESFCDTGAWLYSEIAEHDSFRLARRWSAERSRWLKSIFLLIRNC